MKKYVLDTGIVLHYIRKSNTYQQIEKDINLSDSDATILISAVTVGGDYWIRPKAKLWKRKINKNE